MTAVMNQNETLRGFIAMCEQQCAMYEQLLACFNDKERAIREARPEAMQAISEREILLLRDLRTHDLRRKQQLNAMLPATASKRHGQQSPGELLDQLDEREREQVQPMVARMRHAADRVRQRSAVLRSAAESLNAHLSGIVRSAWSMMEQNTVYERSGRVATGGANLGIDVRS